MAPGERTRESRLEELFHTATAVDREERSSILAEVEEEDAELAAELRGMLEADHAFEEPEIHPFRVVGPYRLVRRIGQGGMGTVYLARQEQPIERNVALKVMRRGADIEELVHRFHVEQLSLARMDHPGIARVYDAGETPDGLGYFAMEYVPGERITTHADRARLRIAARVEMLAFVCDAVQHAHQKGVIHRDLKPSNVQITMRDGSYVPKVIDFGVAKPLGREQDVTRTGSFIGTPSYMSPEQAGAIPESVDSRSDVYALGVILYELLTGELPHGKGSDETTIAALFQGRDIQSPSRRIAKATDEKAVSLRRARSRAALTREIRGDLDWITLRALAREPARRYASASELAEDLRRYLRGEPVSAAAPGTAYRLGKWVSRHRLGAALIAVLALTLVAWGATQSFYNARLRATNHDLLRLSDSRRLELLLEEADRLHPAHPDRIPEYDAWMAQAVELLERREMHRNALRAVRARGIDLNGEWAFDSMDDDWQHAMLVDLVASLEELARPETGVFDNVTARRSFANGVTAQTLDGPARAWELAREELARDPRFDGFTLEPLLGLVPLGKDPASGLQEFAHPQSGAVPERDAHGKLHLGPEHSLVFVLIPGGHVLYGDVRVKNGLPPDRMRPTPPEKPFDYVDLDPFLISKFEMTQAQWTRADGSNPSKLPRHSAVWAKPGTLPTSDPDMHPVESMTLADCERVLHRLGLLLPTGVQWEIAARGETGEGRWWKREDGEPIGENLQSLELVEVGYSGPNAKLKMRDGWAFHAPVGTFLPNPYGLYDVLGNVQEICRDTITANAPVRPGDGLRLPKKPNPMQEIRAGSFARGAGWAADYRRGQVDTDTASEELGVRPLFPLPK